MTISHSEAQQLRENVTYSLEVGNQFGTLTKGQREELTRARELAAIIVSDTMPN